MKKKPDTFFTNTSNINAEKKNTPIMATFDAYLWLRYAKELRENTYRGNDKHRLYPFSKEYFNPPPLLSVLIAKLSFVFNGNIHKTGAYIVVLISSLFIVPFCIYFYKIGYPALGITGALTGSFNLIYLSRTTFARVDTDSLNLFFPFLASMFILLSVLAKTRDKTLLFASLSGFTMFLFTWWYNKVEFVSIYFLCLLIMLIWHKKTVFTTFFSCVFYFISFSPYLVLLQTTSFTYLFAAILLLTTLQVVIVKATLKLNIIKKPEVQKYIIFLFLIFLIFAVYMFSNEIYYLFSKQFNYIYSFLKAGGAPENTNVYSTVTELGNTDLKRIFSYITVPYGFGIAGLSIAVAFFLVNMKRMVVLLPVFFIGLLSFQGSSRFVMYLAPFVGIGYGVFVTFLAKAIMIEAKTSIKLNKQIIIYVLPVVLSIAGSIVFTDNQVLGFFVPLVFSYIIILFIYRDIYTSYISSITTALLLCAFAHIISKEFFINQFTVMFFALLGFFTGTLLDSKLKKYKKRLYFYDILIYALALGMCFFTLKFFELLKLSPQPAINKKVYSSIEELAPGLSPEPAIFSWWDMGYALQDILGATTFTDGGLQHTYVTKFIGRAFVSKSQKELYNIINYLTGNISIVNAEIIKNNQALNKILGSVNKNNIYILFTRDMIDKYSTIFYASYWKDDKQPWHIMKDENLLKSYTSLDCHTYKNNKIFCDDSTSINLKNGNIWPMGYLKEAVFIDSNGDIKNTFTYENKKGNYYLHVFFNEKNSPEETFIADEYVYMSNLHQMFMLGNYDKTIFSEIYNNAPYARMFKVKRTSTE